MNLNLRLISVDKIKIKSFSVKLFQSLNDEDFIFDVLIVFLDFCFDVNLESQQFLQDQIADVFTLKRLYRSRLKFNSFVDDKVIKKNIDIKRFYCMF